MIGDAPRKTSDLGVRTASALVMLVVAGGALWIGGLWWSMFAALVGVGVLSEWFGLVARFPLGPMGRGLWNAGGIVYVGLSVLTLVILRNNLMSIGLVLLVLLSVIATDVGAYFAGRTIGGPKIAPTISPSKTWAGLGGGVVGASLVVTAWLIHRQYEDWLAANAFELEPQKAFAVAWLPALVQGVIGGLFFAVVAQAGDFFESWMKRRAEVKDSGAMIPGHGGLFDRVDGLLAVCFVGAVALTLAALVLGPGVI